MLPSNVVFASSPAELYIGPVGILSLVTWLPLVGAAIVFFLDKRSTDLIKQFATVWMAVCFLVSLPLVLMWNYDVRGLQFMETAEWIPMIGAKYQLGVDGFALTLVMLTTFLGPIVALCSWNYIEKRQKEYYALLLIMQSFMIGVFAAADLFLFYVLFEVMLVPMYLLIGIWGGERRLYSAIKFFVYTLVGSLLMLVAVFKFYFTAAETAAKYPQEVKAAVEVVVGNNAPMRGMVLDGVETARRAGVARAAQAGGGMYDVEPAPYGTFNIYALQAIGSARDGQGKPLVPLTLQLWLFAGFALALAIKVPMVPFHTWLPDAHVEAPTAGSAILAGILLKIGTYGFVRFNFPMFPDAAMDARVTSVMGTLAILGIVYGSLVALAQKDMKKTIAYSSVAHMGTTMLSLFAFNPNGINGAALQMLSHGVTSAALFIMIGILYERRHTRQIADYGGIVSSMPAFSVMFMIATMASVGLPLLNGFVGEFIGLRGVFEANVVWAFWGTTGIILGAAYMLWLYERVFLGPVKNPKNADLPDLSAREWAYLTPLVAAMIIFGVYPKPLVTLINGTTEVVVRQMRPTYFAPRDAASREEKAAVRPAQPTTEH
ncbi:MAG: NADH-quinone oxidoreductase subunit M [Chloracidobacterium sp.]|uniref:NADH-quinone oxidoreductase subunit M n=1 Tax=Chloracidobacterium validum TaxID=2821543 RepID=A0ABX8B6T9_9BACT|nr:NADH-quinone oxidoreductase subunit M [Chloracidobacterium validum]QUW02678.1 NADH-quinone oxidoreductase subunit M [Chloracidobacterium validum]